MMRFWYVLLGAACLSSSAFGAVWYVDIDSPAVPIGQNGASWAKAFDQLQEAADAASNDGGGEVWVAEGTYTSTGPYVLQLREGVHLYGGFVGNGTGGGETARTERNWTAHVSSLDGQAMRSCVQGASNATLDGFTIKNGRGVSVPMTPLSRGGGILNVGVSPTITNCVFTGNSARSGSAIWCEDSSAVITHCVFLANNAMYDGALCITGSASPVVRNCIFAQNRTDYQGNAVSIVSVGATAIANCIFAGNRGNASQVGGALLLSYGTPEVTNCLFVGNRAGAIANDRSAPVIVNCTFDRNVSGSNAGAIINSSTVTATVTNCILWASVPAEIYDSADSSTSATYSNIQGGYPGEGNFTPPKNPRFLWGPSGSSTGLTFDAAKSKSTLTVAGAGFAHDAYVGSILWVAGTQGDTAYVICGSDGESLVAWGDATEGGAIFSPVDFAVTDNRLAADSPCRDAGRDTSAPEYGGVTTDILGHPRGSDGAGDDPTGPPPPGDGSDYDMGAYEMPAKFAPADVNHSGDVDAVDVQLVINQALEIATGYYCDIDCSGAVDAIDVQRVINAALGIV